MRGYRKYRRYKRRENRVHRKERTFHRWLAVFMAAVLLMGECNLTVLAEEVTLRVEESEDGAPDEDNTDENICVCENRCSEDRVNEDCPACTEDYVNCIGQENGETEESDGSVEGELPEGDVPELPELAGGAMNGAAAEEAVIEEAAVSGDEGIDADDGKFSVDRLQYIIIGDNKDEVEVIGHEDGTAVSGGLAIPAAVSYKGSSYRVTSIGEKAFAQCSSLTSIEIPDSVTSIGNGAFSQCSSLTGIEIPNSVTSIGNGAFTWCSSLTGIEIPNSVTSIGDHAFNNCDSLTGIEIPNSVTSIGDFAFNDCGSLTGIEIPNSVTSISRGTFYRCDSLTSIKIPNSVTNIGDHAFNDCRSLTSIEIPNSVTSIGDGAFAQCSLTGIEIPNSVTSIGESAFMNCRSLTGIKIPNGVTKIDRYAFYGCSSLTSIEIPSGIKIIESFAFQLCTKLRTLQIVVPSDGTGIIVPSAYGTSVFMFTPDDRYIVFVSEDGTPLTGSALEAAQNAFKDAKGDGNATDNLWWGWKIGEPDMSSSITIHVWKDDTAWADHNRTFGLKQADSPDAALITDFTKVADGQYRIYDTTDAADGASGTDTGVLLTVNGGLAEAVVNYYTVTFYDSSADGSAPAPYGDGTPQKPQIISAGQTASEPAAPSKTGHEFKGWVTAEGGDIPYDFGTTVNAKTKIYAGWTADAYHITYHLDGYTASEADSKYTYGGRTLPKPARADYDFDGWYINADYSGGKTDAIGSTETGDKEYYGQWIKKPESTYHVNVTVRKDDAEWKDHGRTFMLLSAADGSLTANFETVKQGEYYIYDVTGVPSESLVADGINTGVRVPVEDKDAEAAVDYYTVTFYDSSADGSAPVPYGNDTPQAEQTVLKGGNAIKPADPSKAGHQFNQWVTGNNGSEAFRFDTPITQKSSAYADWISEAAAEYIIEASAGEGGSIFPAGNVRVEEGGEQTFEMTPDEGYRIKAVIVDGADVTEEITDSAAARILRAQSAASRYYTFTDVRADHTIRVAFEADNGGTGDNSGGGNGGTGDNSGGSGNGGTGDNSGGGGNGGTGDNSGGSGGNGGTGGDNTGGNGSTGDNSGGSGNTGTGGDNTGGSDNPGTGGDSDNTVINVGIADGSISENSSGDTDSSHAENSSSSSNSNNSGNSNTSNASAGAEPKTGDTSHVEIYATVAMIAGLTYLLLYFADKEKGMTEEEKQEIISSMIGWAKRGRRIRKYIVLVPIFIVLFYYHSIGKRVTVEWESINVEWESLTS